MADPVTRPRFAEGQILAAADLTALGDLPRAAAQRHNRFVHRWGIVSGLELTAEPAKDAGGNDYAKVSLSPGMAIDGEGRELLLTSAIALNPAQLKAAIGNTIAEAQNYPVFLTAKIEPGLSASNAATSVCGASAAVAGIEEAVDVVFMPPGEELSEQQPSAISTAPAPDGAARLWTIFLGYVTWTATAEAFAGIEPDAAARLRPMAGINAATVAGNSGRMLLHPAATPVAGSAVAEIAEGADGPSLIFGTWQSALAPLDPLMTIDAKGDLTVKGAIVSQTIGSSVALLSGIASDGVALPLPTGVTEAQLADGSARLHIQISPLIDPQGSPDPTADYAALVQECRVDEARVVRCRVCWLSLPTSIGGGVLGATAVSQPGQVNYLICATVSGA